MRSPFEPSWCSVLSLSSHLCSCIVASGKGWPRLDERVGHPDRSGLGADSLELGCEPYIHLTKRLPPDNLCPERRPIRVIFVGATLEMLNNSDHTNYNRKSYLKFFSHLAVVALSQRNDEQVIWPLRLSAIVLK